MLPFNLLSYRLYKIKLAHLPSFALCVCGSLFWALSIWGGTPLDHNAASVQCLCPCTVHCRGLQKTSYHLEHLSTFSQVRRALLQLTVVSAAGLCCLAWAVLRWLKRATRSGGNSEALLWALGHELLWALGMLQGHPALCSVVATKPEPNAAEQIFCAGKSQNVNSRAQIALEKTHFGLLLQPFQLVAATSFSPRILSLGQRSSAHSHYYLWLLQVGSRGWQRQHQWAVGKSKLFLVGKAWFWKQKSCRKHLLSYFSPPSKPEIFIFFCILEVKNFQFRWKIVDVFRTCPKGGRCSPFFFTYDLSGQAVELHRTAGSLQSLG